MGILIGLAVMTYVFLLFVAWKLIKIEGTIKDIGQFLMKTVVSGSISKKRKKYVISGKYTNEKKGIITQSKKKSKGWKRRRRSIGAKASWDSLTPLQRQVRVDKMRITRKRNKALGTTKRSIALTGKTREVGKGIASDGNASLNF